MSKINRDKPKVYDHTFNRSMSDTGKRIFLAGVIIYILIDLSEKLLDTRFEAWIYATLFGTIIFGLVIIGISELEKNIMRKLND